MLYGPLVKPIPISRFFYAWHLAGGRELPPQGFQDSRNPWVNTDTDELFLPPRA